LSREGGSQLLGRKLREFGDRGGKEGVRGEVSQEWSGGVSKMGHFLFIMQKIDLNNKISSLF